MSEIGLRLVVAAILYLIKENVNKFVMLILLCFVLSGCSWASRMSYKGRAYFGIKEENVISNDKSSLDRAE